MKTQPENEQEHGEPDRASVSNRPGSPSDSSASTADHPSATVPVENRYIHWSKPIPQLRKPTLILAFGGWNDAGSAATAAAQHLIAQWNCTEIADIDPETFYDFTSTRPIVQLDKQKQRYIKWPSNGVTVAQLPQAKTDVVVILGVEPQLKWRTFSEQLLIIAKELQVSNVITLGALLAEVPHSRPIEIYGTADNESLRKKFNLLPSTYEGPTGIVGILTNAYRDAGYPTISFWAAVPSYIPGTPSPKAALALVSRASAMVGAPVATVDLERAATAHEREISQLAEKDEGTSEYVRRLERAWDIAQANREAKTEAPESAPLEDDPTTLVAEVEEYLRDKETDD